MVCNISMYKKSGTFYYLLQTHTEIKAPKKHWYKAVKAKSVQSNSVIQENLGHFAKWHAHTVFHDMVTCSFLKNLLHTISTRMLVFLRSAACASVPILACTAMGRCWPSLLVFFIKYVVIVLFLVTLNVKLLLRSLLVLVFLIFFEVSAAGA